MMVRKHRFIQMFLQI